MKTAAALLCVLVLAGASASRVKRSAKAALDDHASANAVETAPQWRQSSEPSSFAGVAQLLPMLRGLWSVGSQLISSLGMDGAGEDVARALQESDPVELALNTIDLDTAPCRQRLACEIRSAVGEYAFGSMAFELLASRVPSLKKYGRVSARQLGVSSCSEAFSCRYADSPLMDTARQMRSMAGDYCSMDSETLTGRLCLAFSYVMDTLESL